MINFYKCMIENIQRVLCNIFFKTVCDFCHLQCDFWQCIPRSKICPTYKRGKQCIFHYVQAVQSTSCSVFQRYYLINVQFRPLIPPAGPTSASHFSEDNNSERHYGKHNELAKRERKYILCQFCMLERLHSEGYTTKSTLKMAKITYSFKENIIQDTLNTHF